MKLEKITCAFLIVLLIIAFTMPFSLALPEQTKIYVDPPRIIDSGISPSQNITIDIMVADVTDLYSWQVKIHYNATILNATDVSLPPNHVFAGRFYYAPEPIINNTEGYVWFGATLLWVDPMWTFDGTGVLCNITFHVNDRGYTPLRFSQPYGGDTFLYHRDWSMIPASTEDGFFSNKLFGYANLFDLSKAYGSKPGDANWNPNCNFNWDDKVDVSDLFLLGKNYG